MIARMRGGAHFNIIGHARRWFIFSGVLVLISLTSLFFREVNAGLEFSGGTAFQVQADNDVSVQEIRDELDAIGLESVTVQEIGAEGFRVQTEHLDPREQERAAEEIAKLTGVRSSEVNVTTVGPKWGQQITNKAIRALIFFFIFVVAYLSIRLEPKMAGATMIALLHDLIVTAGIYSLSGFEVTPSTVIGVLTILGYSLYDTVVIFDRVKERTSGLSAAGRVTYSEAANDSLNQVLLRSFNTSLISLIPVGSLLFVGSFLLGAETLRELALALFVGLAAGAYSSVFIATPIVAMWKEREERWSSLRVRIAARGAEASTVPSAPSYADPAVAATPVATVVEQQPRPKPRQQQRRKKRKHGR
jgi:preprotein translocase subunit SecF